MASLVLPLLQKRDRVLRVAGRGASPPDRERLAPDASKAAAAGHARQRPGFVLLIVDDDPLMTDMLPRRLRKVLRADVDIRTATTAEEAFALIRDLGPDAVMSDYNLRQVQTGLDVLREAEVKAPRAARILFSGHAAEEIDGLDGASIHAYVEKPMRLDELITPVLEAIQRATGEDLRGGASSG